jgi:hypothetical protein
VTERDAFGNPIPERPTTTQPVTSGDPLGAGSTVRVAAAAFGDDAMGGAGVAIGGGAVGSAAMGGGGTTAAPPRPAPAPASSPPPPSPATVFAGGAIPTLPNYGPSKTTALGRAVRWFMVLLFVAPFAIGGLVAYNAFHTAKATIPIIKSIRDLAPTNPSNNAKPAAAAPTGVAGTSMLRAANLDRALRAARKDPGGKLALVRVAPERADLQLKPRTGGGLDLLQLRADGGRSLVQTPAGTGTARLMSFAQIDTQAPARLVRRAAKRLHRSSKAIDYVVLVDGVGWSAYFQGGAAFQGDAHGHVTRRIQ